MFMMEFGGFWASRRIPEDRGHPNLPYRLSPVQMLGVAGSGGGASHCSDRPGPLCNPLPVHWNGPSCLQGDIVTGSRTILLGKESPPQLRGQTPFFRFLSEPGLDDPLPPETLLHDGGPESGQAVHLVAQREAIRVPELRGNGVQRRARFLKSD